jgi:hypothetical protein
VLLLRRRRSGTATAARAPGDEKDAARPEAARAADPAAAAEEEEVKKRGIVNTRALELLFWENYPLFFLFAKIKDWNKKTGNKCARVNERLNIRTDWMIRNEGWKRNIGNEIYETTDISVRIEK